LARISAELVSQLRANLRGDVGVLKKDGALEKLPAVQPGPENEMTVEQRSGFAEQREKIVVTHSVATSV